MSEVELTICVKQGSEILVRSSGKVELPVSCNTYRCPTCRGPLTPTPGTFYLRGRSFAGLVCAPCKTLYDNPDDSMFEYARALAAEAEDDAH